MANDVATADAGLAPIVEISTGKLRGTSNAGICSFKGIPYAASTAGRGRFMPPEPARPWSGVREALAMPGAPGNCPTDPNGVRCSKPCSGRPTPRKRRAAVKAAENNVYQDRWYPRSHHGGEMWS